MLPAPANATFDLYRGGAAPPASPTLAGLAGHLRSTFREGIDALADAPSSYTHLLLVDPLLDVRDIDDSGSPSSVDLPDRVFIPDATGVGYLVVFVERRLRGTPFDHRRVYLSRSAVAWPSDDV